MDQGSPGLPPPPPSLSLQGTLEDSQTGPAHSSTCQHMPGLGWEGMGCEIGSVGLRHRESGGWYITTVVK